MTNQVLLGASHLSGSDLVVSRLALGGNMLGGRLDASASFALLDRFAEAGGRLVDTAAVYADWLPDRERGCSEKTLGRWLRSRRGTDVVVATKGGHPALDDPERSRLDQASVRADVEQSLVRLGLSSLPLWFTHRDDPTRPVAEIIGDLEALRAEGLVRWYGMANWTTPRLAEVAALRASGAADGFVATQSALAAAVPRPDALAVGLVAADEAMLRLHRTAGLTLLAYSAQAKGYFDRVSRLATGAGQQAGGPGEAAPDAAVDLYDSPGSRRAAEVVDRVAAAHRTTPTQVALAALLLVDASVIPVVGCSSVARLSEVLAAAALELSEEEGAALREVLPMGGSGDGAAGPP